MHTFRTVLEQKIRERRQTLEEFTEYAETFAREHNEPGTLSVRHLQRLAAGQGAKGQPLGQVRPATARLLEKILGLSIEELLAPPPPTAAGENSAGFQHVSAGRVDGTTVALRPAKLSGVRGLDRQIEHMGVSVSFDWLDEHAGWTRDTSRREVMSRLAKLDTRELHDQQTRRAKVGRSQVARALSEYYSENASGYGIYRAACGDRHITTSILTRQDWLDLRCPLAQGDDRLTLVNTSNDDHTLCDDASARRAVHRLAEVAALGVRLANMPLYRLLEIVPREGVITGTVALASFAEYALTVDLLEAELADALTAGAAIRPGTLPLRQRYLPDLASVFDLQSRLCAGGVLALCAIARPSDPYRGPADYALLVQQRSGQVVNAARQLSVIPKGFHQPLTDVRADAQIGATLRRDIEEELFGRSEVDSTACEQRAALPMHPSRLSEPMRWLVEDPARLRMECTGFGLNLVSGNYEFASLVVVDDEEFWTRYGGQVEANWEAAGLRLYSSLDAHLISELATEESWSNEGLFALLQGIRRLRELRDDRVNLPAVEWDLGS